MDRAPASRAAGRFTSSPFGAGKTPAAGRRRPSMPNRAGMRCAVRILATLLQADSGRAMVAGYDVRSQPQRVRQQIGLTGQFASVDEDLTGTQNLVMIGQLLDLTTRDARLRAKELLAWF